MENLAFHSLLRWKMIIPSTLTTSPIHFSLKGWENVRFELMGVKWLRVTHWQIAYLTLPGDGQPSVSKYSAHAKSSQQQSTADAGKAGKLVADALLQDQRDLGRVEPSILLPKRGTTRRALFVFFSLFFHILGFPSLRDSLQSPCKIFL